MGTLIPGIAITGAMRSMRIAVHIGSVSPISLVVFGARQLHVWAARLEGVYGRTAAAVKVDMAPCTPYTVRKILCDTQVRCMNEELFENLRLELRRGLLTVAVLAELKGERYGYALRKALAESGLDIEDNTLYPLLRRLESQGMLISAWREENKRNKRFYRLSPEGRETLAHLLNEWRSLNTSLDRIVEAAPAPSTPPTASPVE